MLGPVSAAYISEAGTVSIVLLLEEIPIPSDGKTLTAGITVKLLIEGETETRITISTNPTCNGEHWKGGQPPLCMYDPQQNSVQFHVQNGQPFS
jgi:hypothetical protein